MDLKREVVKYIRDGAKSLYKKGTECEICGVTENLDFHHFYSVSELAKRWIAKNRFTKEQAVENRDDFISEHKKELYEDTVTLCHDHHLKLHSIYGQHPVLGTAKKQARWVKIQREKHNGVV